MLTVNGTYNHLKEVINLVTLPGDFAEFGVWKGTSANFIFPLMKLHQKLHLFDSFEGLPHDWEEVNDPYPKGTFKLEADKIPTFKDPRIILYKGWFEDTLPSFVLQQTPLAFVHIDCDLYSSAKTVLTYIDKLLVPGTLIVFDEWPWGEEKAFKEHCEIANREFRIISKTKTAQIGIEVLK